MHVLTSLIIFARFVLVTCPGLAEHFGRFGGKASFQVRPAIGLSARKASADDDSKRRSAECCSESRIHGASPGQQDRPHPTIGHKSVILITT